MKTATFTILTQWYSSQPLSFVPILAGTLLGNSAPLQLVRRNRNRSYRCNWRLNSWIFSRYRTNRRNSMVTNYRTNMPNYANHMAFTASPCSRQYSNECRICDGYYAYLRKCYPSFICYLNIDSKRNEARNRRKNTNATRWNLYWPSLCRHLVAAYLVLLLGFLSQLSFSVHSRFRVFRL